MNKFIYEILPLEKFQASLKVTDSECKKLIRKVAYFEFEDKNLFTKRKTATYSVSNLKNAIKITRNVQYMNFMRPEGVIKIRKNESNNLLDLTIRPFIPGFFFISGFIVVPIIIFTQTVTDFKSLNSIFSGLFVSTSFLLFGYFATMIAFKTESTKMKKDMVDYMLKNNIIE